MWRAYHGVPGIGLVATGLAFRAAFSSSVISSSLSSSIVKFSYLHYYYIHNIKQIYYFRKVCLSL